ncbi:MAG: histidine--tRNA ligase [Bacteroidota bacterium]
MKFRSIKGTRDILPEESHRWINLEGILRDRMRLFNYREIRTPLFEETALFARSIGELTDIVGKEMYTFQDQGGTSLTLKPEMTASVVRAYIQNNLGELQPLQKVYYISPMFRQERPQAGRLRQFTQFGAEAIGGPNPEIDAEVIALACDIYAAVGIKNILLKINSVGCEKCRPAYKQKLQEFFRDILDQLSEQSRARFEGNPLRILDSKDEKDQALTKDAPLMKDHLCPECNTHFQRLLEVLKQLDIPFVIDGRIVRGLDYYTKTAFEIVSTDLGSQDALAGGGRYDLLVQQLGGKPTPAVGWAAGMERLLMVMEKQFVPAGENNYPVIFLVGADDDGRKWSIGETMKLRRNTIACECDLLGRSVKSQMREADRQKADYVLIVGENELKANKGILKNMNTGAQEQIALDSIHSKFKS